jgi:hypothetical protein
VTPATTAAAAVAIVEETIVVPATAPESGSDVDSDFTLF